MNLTVVTPEKAIKLAASDFRQQLLGGRVHRALFWKVAGAGGNHALAHLSASV